MDVGRLSMLTGLGMIMTLAATEALANHYISSNSSRARAEIRGNLAEIEQERAELRSAIDEYYRDRAALQRAIQRGASPREIARRRAEVHEDLRRIAESRQELRRDYRELHEDLEKYGWYRRSDGRWYRHPGRGYSAYADHRWQRDRHDRRRWSWWD